jgi:hypothetical protein
MLVMMLIMAISHPGARRRKPLLADACFGVVSLPVTVKHIARAQIDKDGRRACLRGRPCKVGDGARLTSGLVSNKGGREA